MFSLWNASFFPLSFPTCKTFVLRIYRNRTSFIKRLCRLSISFETKNEKNRSSWLKENKAFPNSPSRKGNAESYRLNSKNVAWNVWFLSSESRGNMIRTWWGLIDERFRLFSSEWAPSLYWLDLWGFMSSNQAEQNGNLTSSFWDPPPRSQLMANFDLSSHPGS